MFHQVKSSSPFIISRQHHGSTVHKQFLLCQYLNHLNTLIQYCSTIRGDVDHSLMLSSSSKQQHDTMTSSSQQQQQQHTEPILLRVYIESSNHLVNWSGDFESIDSHLNIELRNVRTLNSSSNSFNNNIKRRPNNVSSLDRMATFSTSSTTEFSHLRLSGKFIKYIAVMNIEEIISHLNTHSMFESIMVNNGSHVECCQVRHVFNRKQQLQNYYSAQSKRKKRSASQRPSRKVIESDLPIVRDF
ncbi:hypothetical protein C9374_003765 [Naegleria lovaniensis]|uniref:Uncharacterized protein n=1 Tax=Naegleria lovaniensis TaxID=51637 RepID=A0AA88H839_NAELO|nr:uncharacterized protein C9374_003765 [Naegleria lovaniensis]KAG2394001.1 hypothetical protein C9374_003765 [Naegleria lovaniensis]